MNTLNRKRVLSGNDRRLQVERRQFSYTRHIPERRSRRERRDQVAANHVIHFITADGPESVLAA